VLKKGNREREKSMMDMERKRMYQTYVGLKDMERKQALIALVTHRINFNNRWRKKSDV
jgi:hypothetical protein